MTPNVSSKMVEPVVILRDGCGWLAAYSDGTVRCTNPNICSGPHAVSVVL